MTPMLDVEKYRNEAQELNRGYVTFEVSAKALLSRGIETDEDYQSCVALATEAAKREKVISDKFNPLCDLLHKAHKMSTGLRAEFMKPWTDLKAKLSDRAAEWYLEQKRAKQAAEAEMSKLAEKQQGALVDRAEELLLQGDVRAADQVLAQARATVAPILPEAVPKVEGARVREKYEGTCTDILALAKAIVEGRVPLMWKAFDSKGNEKWERPLISCDQTVLNVILDRQGASTNLPGVTVKEAVRIGAARL